MSLRQRPDGLILHLSTGASHGYPVVGLWWDRECVRRPVHHLVTAAFIGPRPTGAYINHKNSIRTDNRPNNLEYVTPAENQRHAARNGRMQHGEARWNARLKRSQVLAIRDSEESNAVIARRYGVSISAISDVRRGRSWWHAGGRVRARRQPLLAAEQISEIRSSTDGIDILAARYGVHRKTIWRLRPGRFRSRRGVPL